MTTGVNPLLIRRLVTEALMEDLGPGDITGAPLGGALAEGRIVAEDQIVVAGLQVAAEVFAQVDGETAVTLLATDGASARPGDELARVSGRGSSLLAAERVALNFLQRMSGVATLTRRYVQAVEGTGAVICDTRKTTPLLRHLEKYAVRMGGGRNHRIGLYDGILIKENHIAFAGGLTQAVEMIRAQSGHLRPIEVETTTLDEVREALAAKADVIMLDNFSLPDMKQAVAMIRQQTAGRVPVEASGGVNLDTVRAIAETGVNLISVGRLTHSAPAAELSMDIFPARA